VRAHREHLERITLERELDGQTIAAATRDRRVVEPRLHDDAVAAQPIDDGAVRGLVSKIPRTRSGARAQQAPGERALGLGELEQRDEDLDDPAIERPARPRAEPERANQARGGGLGDRADEALDAGRHREAREIRGEVLESPGGR
jgi:hypothetical protein